MSTHTKLKMKISLIVFISLFILTSCVEKDPQLSEADYRKEQQEYEQLKAKLEGGNKSFFLENKEAIFSKINLFKKLKDTTTLYENVNNTEDFYLDDIKLQAINYNIGNKEGLKAVFLEKEKDGTPSFNRKLEEPYDALYFCESNDEDKCSNLDLDVIKEFLDIKYVFIINGYRLMEPKITGSKSFESGLFIADIVVYDIDNDKPIYNYSVSATNNEEISVVSLGRGAYDLSDHYIANDFNNNINENMRVETEKYFNFSD